MYSPSELRVRIVHLTFLNYGALLNENWDAFLKHKIYIVCSKNKKIPMKLTHDYFSRLRE